MGGWLCQALWKKPPVLEIITHMPLNQVYAGLPDQSRLVCFSNKHITPTWFATVKAVFKTFFWQ